MVYLFLINENSVRLYSSEHNETIFEEKNALSVSKEPFM